MARADAESVHHALRGLAPEGRALKRHILEQLLGRAPEGLTASEVAAGGPKRTDASVRYALRALERVGVVQRTSSDDVMRFRLAQCQDEVVRDFLADEPTGEERFPVSPLPALPRYRRLLDIFCGLPESAFTVVVLSAKVRLRDAAVRRSVQELHEAGYLIRTLPDPNAPGRPQFRYRLNPDAGAQVFTLVNGVSWSDKPLQT